MAENASDPTTPVFDAGALTTLAEDLGRELALNFAARWSDHDRGAGRLRPRPQLYRIPERASAKGGLKWGEPDAEDPCASSKRRIRRESGTKGRGLSLTSTTLALQDTASLEAADTEPHSRRRPVPAC